MSIMKGERMNNSLEEYLSECPKFVLDDGAVRGILKNYRDNEKFREALILNYLKRAAYISSMFEMPGVDLMDLIGVANCTIIETIDNYDIDDDSKCYAHFFEKALTENIINAIEDYLYSLELNVVSTNNWVKINGENFSIDDTLTEKNRI